jgi:SAM-dependent methyltransferase
MADEKTLQFYAHSARTYAAHGNDAPSQNLLSFVAALPPEAKVLELGTGGGRDAMHMLAQGIALDPTDGSAELAAEARARIGKPVAIMRFDQLAASACYDGVWANASLLHAPRAELTDDLTRIHRALRPGGLFVSSFKAGQGEGRDKFGRYYNYPDTDTLDQHFRAAADWRSLDISQRAGSGYDGLPTNWLWVVARK